MNARRTLRHLTASVLLGCLAAAAPAAAADWEGGRWLLGLDVVSSTIGANEDAADLLIDETAPGAGLQIGYLFTPNFQVRLFAAAPSTRPATRTSRSASAAAPSTPSTCSAPARRSAPTCSAVSAASRWSRSRPTCSTRPRARAWPWAAAST
ncbi:MAG: hypothetical protein IPI34_14670 [bacterium]|nr:hypothetical protein [bacterium]